MDTPPTFSFIFITANRREMLLEALESVAHLPANAPYEIIVVDNGSTDGTLEQVGVEFPSVKQVRIDENRGVAFGRNTGVSHASGKYLIFIDDDAILMTGDILTVLAARYAGDPELATIGFKIINDRKNTVLSHEFPMRHYDRKHFDQEQDVSYFIGCGFSIRRDLFQNLGGFYEELFYALEEVELSYRLLDQGYRILYCPEIIVRHKTPPEVRRKGPWYYNFIRSRILMVLRNLPFWAAIPHLLIWHFYLLGQSARQRTLRWFLKGAASGWRAAPDALARRQPIKFSTAMRIHSKLSGRIFF